MAQQRHWTCTAAVFPRTHSESSCIQAVKCITASSNVPAANAVFPLALISAALPCVQSQFSTDSFTMHAKDPDYSQIQSATAYACHRLLCCHNCMPHLVCQSYKSRVIFGKTGILSNCALQRTLYATIDINLLSASKGPCSKSSTLEWPNIAHEQNTD